MQRTAALLLVLSLSKTAASQVVINEIGIAPAGGSGSQFTELFNRSGCAVDLSCYTLVFSSTSGGGNPTGWTVKIPSGKSIAAGGYFLLGGTAGAAGLSGGTGYPTGGATGSYAGTADVNVGTAAITANAVYTKQFLDAGSFPNTKGQLTLLDATGNPLASVSYNNGNNPGSYPLSAYTTCAASGNMQGLNNVPDPGASVNNVTAAFTAATNQGIYLRSNGTYATETGLTPGAANAGNGGTQICSGPVLNSVSSVAVCANASTQTVTVSCSAANAPVTYSLTWSTTPLNNFTGVNNASIGSGVSFNIPANTAPGIYTGYLTLANGCGGSCTKSFTVTVSPLPFVSAGTYGPVCLNALPVNLLGTPGGGIFTGAGVTANLFTPAAAGNYTVSYAYTDAITGCTNQASAVVAVSVPTNSYITACTGNTPYFFYGQPLTATGLHTVLLPNGNGCTDTASIYLVVKQTISVDTAACDSITYNGTAYYADANLTQTIGSAITACDSVVKNVHIRVKEPGVRDTTVCLPYNGSFALLGQTFTASGNYVLHTVNAAGCDSTIRLRLTVAATQTQTHAGCDSVRLNGQFFYASASFTDTLQSQSGCDSLIRIHNVIVRHGSHTYTTACLAAGQTFTFNGQTLSSSGTYSATLNGTFCDSIVHLYLVVARAARFVLNGCDRVVYNGNLYTASTVVRDTVKSVITFCDSLYREAEIIINPLSPTFITACVSPGGGYLFNGQALTSSGHYTTTYSSSSGCDSIVNLHLVVGRLQTQTLTGCDTVVYKGGIYTTSTSLSDTLKSAATQCDSLITVTAITVYKKPTLNISNDTTICRWGTAALTASSSNAAVSWPAIGNTSTISVSPQSSTAYVALAVDAAGCTNKKTVTVSVQNFFLHLSADRNPALSGTSVTVQSSSNVFYSTALWEPVAMFDNQGSREQRFTLDTSVTVIAVAQTTVGCRDTATLNLTAIPLDDVYIPSGFTPNGDGRNDEVRIMGTGIKQLTFAVFNRWGQPVFSTADKSKGWNGKLKGTTLPAGVYVYVARIVKANGRVTERKGTITLIR